MENKNYSNENELPKRPIYAGENKKSGGEGDYALDEPLMGEIIWRSQILITTNNENDRRNATIALEKAMRQFVLNREKFAEEDIKAVRSLAIAPFAICNRLIGDFRTALRELKCTNHHSNTMPLLVIFGAMLILGFGRTMPWSLGIPLVDDNVKKQQMPIYFGANGGEGLSLLEFLRSYGAVLNSRVYVGASIARVLDVLAFKILDGEENKLEFSECECADGGIVSKKLCPDNCRLMRYAFFVTIVLGAFIAGTGVVPGMLLLLRSVPPETRSPALGLQGLLVSGIGTLPSPVLWGLVIDSACRVWDYECQKRGACNIYDPWALRMRMHFLYVFIRALSLLADIYMLKPQQQNADLHQYGTDYKMSNKQMPEHNFGYFGGYQHDYNPQQKKQIPKRQQGLLGITLMLEKVGLLY
uniref:Uncharacterized protein n=1 Tax=Meloidogyne javanica TaxID=6303 RepID=A0A915LWH2_MELJA